MNKLVVILIALVGFSNVQAQDLNKDTKFQIKEGLNISVQEINRVEKYGWDNLEVKYSVQNESDFDIRKLDFTIYLMNENDEKVGTIEVHAFNIPKSSEKSLNYVDIGSEYVNTKIDDFSLKTQLLDVVVEGEKIVTISGDELASR